MTTIKLSFGFEIQSNNWQFFNTSEPTDSKNKFHPSDGSANSIIVWDGILGHPELYSIKDVLNVDQLENQVTK